MTGDTDDVINDEEISSDDDYDMFDESAEEPVEGSETEEKVETKEETAEAEAETDESEDEEETASEQKEELVPQAAYIAERKKRQALEQKLKDQEQKQEVPDPVTDPEAYDKYLSGKTSKEILDLRIEMSEEAMRDAKEDFDEKNKVFFDLVADTDEDGNVTIKDPALQRKFLDAKNPAKFAYEHAQKHLDYVKKTSPDYEKQLREEIEAKVRKEYEDKGFSVDELPNLTSVPAAAKNSDRVESDTGDIDWD